MLHVEWYPPPATLGQPARPGKPADPVILLHGFTQSGGAWRPTAEALVADGHQVVTVDAPGHGRSSEVRADLRSSADQIVEAAGPGTYVGYSMGARMALHVVLAHPGAVSRLVLISGTAGLDDAADRARRRGSDEEIAARIERDGVEAFVHWWLERPLFATLSPAAAAIESRLDATPAGLASSLRLAGAGTQEPVWDRLAAISVPTLVIAGELDPAYRRHAERLVAAIGPVAELAVIPGAGHAAHLEQPERFQKVLTSFLAG